MTIPEELAVPYHSSSLVGARVLLLAPHPDDETIGCGGSLTLHRSHGDPVKVIVLTDGGYAEGRGADREENIMIREQETCRAMSILGVKDVEFWRLPDRGLVVEAGSVGRLVAALKDYQPTLLYLPSPQEAHPDHIATTELAWAAMEEACFPGRVCLYEVGMPIRPNVLVDITAVVGEKERAMTCYNSQLQRYDYKSMILGLNRYRSYSLPSSVTHAEAFWRLDSGEATTTSLRRIRWQMADRPAHPLTVGSPLVSIIVRTRNRPQLLRECLGSIVAQTYRNIEVVLVNDGGESVEHVLAEFSPFLRISPVVHSQPVGRPGALNAGLRQAKGEFIAYLDDDDVYYPDHIETLVNFLRAGTYQVAYTGVRWAYQRLDPETGAYKTYDIRQEFSKGFDPDWLLFENYIPINAVMHSRKVIEEVGPFDDEMEVLEDWELWIRMSRRYGFAHLAKCTAEYRMRNDGTNVTFPPGRNRMIGNYTVRVCDKYVDQRLEAAQRLFNALKDAVYRLERDLEQTKADSQQCQIQAREFQHQAEKQIAEAAQEVRTLRAQVIEMQSSFAWWLADGIRRVKSRLLPSDTRRGELCERILRKLKERLKARSAGGPSSVRS